MSSPSVILAHVIWVTSTNRKSMSSPSVILAHVIRVTSTDRKSMSSPTVILAYVIQATSTDRKSMSSPSVILAHVIQATSTDRKSMSSPTVILAHVIQATCTCHLVQVYQTEVYCRTMLITASLQDQGKCYMWSMVYVFQCIVVKDTMRFCRSRSAVLIASHTYSIGNGARGLSANWKHYMC